MKKRAFALAAVLALLASVSWTLTRAQPAGAEAAGAEAATALPGNVQVFYYPWYGNPSFYGSWRHWQQGGHTPPADIGSNFYPVLGPYDSGDDNGTVAQQMRWIKQADVGVIVILAQTTDTSKVAYFGGMYTYDAIAGDTAPGWVQASAYCKTHGLIWAPSVGPGFISTRAVPVSTTPALDRDNGATYDTEWNNALGTSTGGLPTWVTITSFNEWHEGSQIEPATSVPPSGYGYLTFDGAYGQTGAAAKTAYLNRTAYWVNRFESLTRQHRAYAS